MNKRGRGGGEGGGSGASIPICARKLQTLKGDECGSCSKETPLFITCLVVFFFSRRFDTQRVKSYIICFCTWIEILLNISIDSILGTIIYISLQR